MAESLAEMLIRHEGLRLKPYQDTVGKLTVGVGRNLDDVGITHQEAMLLLKHDIQNARSELLASYPWVKELDQARENVLVNMVFNLGLPRFSRFRKMLAALKEGDYDLTAQEMLASRWARQVRGRAYELANIMQGESV